MGGASGLGIRRRLATAALLCCALTALAATPALAKPASTKADAKPNAAGSLDTSFGKGGKVTVAFPSESGGEGRIKYDLPYAYTAGHIEMAAAPGGKIVVAGATKIVRYLANGKLDPSFGSGGVVAVQRPPGMNFILASVAVDSQGRILLAGSARPMPTSSTPNPLLSSAMVMRFTAAGAPDPSFGKEGTLITDFGFGAPKGAGGSSYIGPSVGLRSMAVDSQGRPLISGGYVKEFGDCYSSAAISVGFVARLTASGALDTSFGESGLRLVNNLASFPQIGLTPAGGLLAVGNGGGSCGSSYEGGPPLELAGLSGEGSLDPGFGFSGFRVIGSMGNSPAVAIAPSGKILLLGPAGHTRRGKKRVKEQALMRLLPNGAADPSFGRIGQIGLLLPADGSFSALAVDASGRVILAGRRSKRVAPKSSKNPLRRSTFWVARLTDEGFDRSFGNKSSVTTGFGGPSNSFATQVVLLNGNRMLVGGGISSPQLASGGGFAIAKYVR